MLRRIATPGSHFRKQVAIGPYIVDFACLSAGLVIELDGIQHANDDARRYDDARTSYLERQGYRVIRFWNADVTRRPEATLDHVHAVLHGSRFAERANLRFSGAP